MVLPIARPTTSKQRKLKLATKVEAVAEEVPVPEVPEVATLPTEVTTLPAEVSARFLG